MHRKYYTLLTLLGLILCSSPLSAQDYDSRYGLEYRKWRVTLINPIGTNGLAAADYSAKYSLNVIGGYHGGLDGYEIGGVYNYTKYYASGFQLAGFANISNGLMEGVNFSGGINYSGDDMSGVQFAGLANISGDDIEGLQFAGGVNYSEDGSSGLRAAGIANISNSYFEGLQAATGFNYAKGDNSGLQAAGLFNYAGGSIEGLQAAGGFNFAGDNISGLMAAGGGNIAFGTLEGLLAAGGFNYAKDEITGLVAAGGLNMGGTIQGLAAAGGGNIAKVMEGLQFGTLNISQESMGLQVGVINIAKEFEGVPIGLISLYGNGRKNFDIRYSDAGFTEVGINLGTYRVYNMLVLGYNTSLDRNVYRVGLAVGLEKNIEDSFENITSSTLFVNQEFAMNHHFEEDWSRTKNRIYSYKFMVGNRFGNGLSLYGGPSLNMQVTRVDGTNDYTWYSFWSPERKGRQYRFWVGFTVGLRLFKQKNLPLLEDEFDDWDWDW
jgi:hypothetical protein